jgi:hypothetical protein
MNAAFLRRLLPALLGASAASAADPILHYPFDGDLDDASPSGNPATSAGAATVSSDPGKPVIGSGAAVFTGAAGSWLSLAAPVAFTNRQTWSAAFWAKRTGTANDKGMVLGDTNNTQNFIYFTDGSKCLRFRASNNTADFPYVVDRQIHHYALTVAPKAADGNTVTVSLYLDGAFLAAKDCGSGAMSVNAVGQGYSNNNYIFSGTLDDVRLYDGLLAPAEIAALYAMRGGPLARWNFEGDFADSTGNGRDGTATGAGLSFTVDADALRVGTNALALNGSAHLTLANPLAFADGEQWSAAFWARRAGTANQGMVMGDTAGSSDFIWVTGNFNGFRFRPSAGGSLDFTCAKDPLMHHYALTANGDGTMTLYVDGSLKQTLAFGDTSFKVNRIGYAYENDGYTFKGVLDDVRVYNYAVGASSVSNLFASGGSQRFHFDFEGGLQDRSPYGVTATANGSAAVSVDASAPVGNGSLVLDGADASYLALSPALALANSNAWSAVFWARKTGNSNQGMVMGDRSNITDFLWLTGDPANKGFRFRPHSGGGNSRDFTTPRDGALRHYALVSLGNGTLHLYLDGGFSEALSTPDTSVTINSIGCAYSSSGFNYKGALDDVRVFSYALAPTNIAFLYGLRQAEPPPLVTRVRVFLQGGQSNSEGRADPAQLPAGLQLPQDDVDFYYYADNALTKLRPATNGGTQFGPEITFGRRLSDRLCRDASNRVAVVKYSVGGSNLHTQWKAGGDATTAGDGPYYVNWQNTVAAGLAALAANYPYAEITVEGMIWMQGESDADTAEHGAAYDANLTALIADIRLTLGLPRLPFVIGRIGQSSLHGRSGYAAVRAAQAAVAARNSWTGWIDTDGFSLQSDNLHFDGPGQMAMGYAFADAVLALPDRGTFFSVR